MATTLKLRIADLDLGYVATMWDLDAAEDAAARRRMRAENLRELDALAGREFYVIRRESEQRGVRYGLNVQAGRTNMSREERVKGWLGNTDGVDYRALGRFAVVGRSSTHLHLREVA